MRLTSSAAACAGQCILSVGPPLALQAAQSAHEHLNRDSTRHGCRTRRNRPWLLPLPLRRANVPEAAVEIRFKNLSVRGTQIIKVEDQGLLGKLKVGERKEDDNERGFSRNAAGCMEQSKRSRVAASVLAVLAFTPYVSAASRGPHHFRRSPLTSQALNPLAAKQRVKKWNIIDGVSGVLKVGAAGAQRSVCVVRFGAQGVPRACIQDMCIWCHVCLPLWRWAAQLAASLSSRVHTECIWPPTAAG